MKEMRSRIRVQLLQERNALGCAGAGLPDDRLFERMIAADQILIPTV